MGQTSRDPLYKRSSAHRALVTALIDHFGLLHDYTRTLNPGFTTGLTLYVVIFQAFTINRPLDYALDSLGLNELSASIIVVLLISVPIFLLISTVAFIIMETRVKRRLDNLPDEVHAHSAWYTIYAYVYRFSFFVTEPATTGFVLSAWITRDPSYHTKELVGRSALIVLTCVAVICTIQSAAYIYLVESTLPGNTLLSATTKVHVLTLNMMQKFGFLIDSANVYIAKQTQDSALVSLMTFVRITPSILTLSAIYHNTYFFSSRGRFYMGAAHSIIIFMLGANLVIYYFIESDNPFKDIIIPALLTISGILKILWNLSRGIIFKPIQLDTCSLSTIVEAAELAILINEDEEEDNSRAAVLLAQVEANLSSKDKKFWRFHQNCLDTKSPHSKAISFVLYLFKLQIQRQPGMTFILKLYLVYYIVRLRMSIYQVNSLLKDLDSAQLTFPRMVALDSVKRLIRRKLGEYAEGRTSYMNTLTSSYFPQTFVSTGKTKPISNAVGVGAELAGAELNFFRAFDAYKAHKLLISYMNKAIDTCLSIYELNDKRNFNHSLLHNHCSRILQIKKMIREVFLKIESLEVPIYRFHYLPYGMFVDNLSNDRATLLRMLKLFQERCKSNFQSSRKLMSTNNKLNLSEKGTVIFVVSASEENLGEIIESSMNFQPVFGIPYTLFQGRNISELLSPDFGSLHRRMFKSLAKNHHRPYLDAVKLRYARITGHNVYTRVAMVTKVYPNMDAGINFISMMRNDDHGHLYLVVSERGTISGYSKEILEFLPQLPFLRDARLSALSEELEPVFASMVAEKLLEGKEVEHSAVELAMRQLGVEGEWRDGLKTRGKMVGMRLSTGGGSVNMNTSTTERSLEGLSQSVRVQEAWVEVIRWDWEGVMYVEEVLHFRLQNEETDWSKRSREKQPEVQRSATKSKSQSPKILVHANSNSGNHEVSLHEDPVDKFSQDINFESKHNPIKRKSSIKMKIVTEIIVENELVTGSNEAKRVMETKDRVENIVFGTATKTEDINERSSLSSNQKMKNKITAAMNKQKRQFVWKEMSGILAVQVIVWSMCLYITVLLDKNFYTELKNLISLRKGILFFTLTNANCWSLGITLFDEMLVRGGYIQPRSIRREVMSPDYVFDYEAQYARQFYAGQNYSLTFLRHVYSFKWEYANRYFINKVNYTYQTSDYDNKTLVTKTYDFRDLYRIVLGAIRRWHDYLEVRPTIVASDFNMYAIRDFLNAQGANFLEKLGTPTILLLLDTDFKTYSSLVSTVRLTIGLAILISLVLSNAILLLVYVVRNKITSLYQCFQKLSHSEISEQRNLLYGMRKTLVKSIEYEELFLEEFHSLSRRRTGVEVTGHHYVSQDKNRHKNRKNMRVFACNEFYGLLNFVLIMFILMEAFNITAFSFLSKISKETNRKLDMLTMSRATITGSAATHWISLRSYALSIQMAGLGLEWYNRTQILTTMTNSKNSLDTQFKLIEERLDLEFEPYPERDQVGWDKFRHSSPCDYVNKPALKMSQSECEKLANGFMGKTPSDMYRWFRLTIDGILTKVRTANKTTALELIQSNEFIEYNFLRRVFAISFIVNVNFDFYYHLETQYHPRIAFMTRKILAVLLICSIIVAAVLNIVGFRHMRTQVSIGLSSLALLPRSSFLRNPYVSVLLRKLS